MCYENCVNSGELSARNGGDNLERSLRNQDEEERATTIPKGSTPEAIAGGSAQPLNTEGEDIV